MIDSVCSLLEYRSANGVNIDFEGIHLKSKKSFTNFIIRLSRQLKTKNPDYMVSVALYAVDYDKIFDIKSIDSSIDFYTLMAYDYYGGFSKIAGPISPLKSSVVWGKNSVESSVTYYLNEGVDSGKLIVGLPYYGAKWEVTNDIVPGEVHTFKSHLTYSTIKKELDTLKASINLDKESTSVYASYKSKDGKIYQLWFEDSTSLAYKYDWIKNQKISGVGLWALGFDEGNTELWNLLATKFGEKK